jgi:4-amino-4-deoxy-L-arabinose transferase-like glycosyltransferase
MIYPRRVFRSISALPILKALPGNARTAALPIAVILIAFGLPLFLGLGARDLRNDESIYSYAVDRILDTGDWMLPRTIPDDYPFLEKPPLKFWIVAAPIAAGVLPHDESGQRAFDALFGAVAFVYVFLLGRSLAGFVCGVTAVLVLFSLPSLVFQHGLRSNNMEASLLLAYCGGIYHFARWLNCHQSGHESERPGGPYGVWHAAAVVACFVLGFMTKFVAVFFLPMICVAALLMTPGGWQRLRQSWRDWRWPAAAALAISAPWFVYQTQQFGAHFWRVIFGAHVYARMTSYLDPQHLNPWTAYFLWTWRDFSAAGAAWLGVAGLARLVAGAWTGRPPLARMIVLWWALPFVVISMGTSKLFHYAYPFLPPLALALGWFVADAARWIDGRLWMILRKAAPAFTSAFASISEPTRWRWGGPWRAARPLLAACAALFLVVAVWTVAEGHMIWRIEGETLMSNSSIIRPIAIASLLLILAGYARTGLRTGMAAAFTVILPIQGYHRILDRMTTLDRPLRVISDCAAEVRQSGAVVGEGFYNAAALVADHPYYYYLRDVGPWLLADRPDDGELRRRLFVPGEQTPIVLSRKDYELLTVRVARLWTGEPPGRPPLTGIAIEREAAVVVLLPGPYATCVDPAAAAGGEEVGDIPQRRSQWEPQWR